MSEDSEKRERDTVGQHETPHRQLLQVNLYAPSAAGLPTLSEPYFQLSFSDRAVEQFRNT